MSPSVAFCLYGRGATGDAPSQEAQAVVCFLCGGVYVAVPGQCFVEDSQVLPILRYAEIMAMDAVRCTNGCPLASEPDTLPLGRIEVHHPVFLPFLQLPEVLL